MDFTPSKKPFVENTLKDVYVLRNELEIEKVRNGQLRQALRDVIDLSNIPKDKIRFYHSLGGRIMKHRTRRVKRGGQPVTGWSSSVVESTDRAPPMPTFSPRLARAEAEDWSVARRLDFGDANMSDNRPGCKRLADQPTCVSTPSATAADRAACLQLGEGQVHSLAECGPLRTGGRRSSRRRTQKHKKSRRTKRHRRV
jgi:hypothetical protein